MDLMRVHPSLGGRAVVALESTLLAHGMPAARRLEVAHRLASAVRSTGAEPAVMAVMDGALRVGLEPDELERLCLSDHVSKCAERDLAVAMAMGGLHATTVSSTMAMAARAGIRVFATGGIGGVHRDAVSTFDESQDLLALARHPVVVISAGAKAILDLPRTLERLETLGVLVVGHRCHEFPAFYTARSGLMLEHATQEVNELARIARTRLSLRQGGMLVALPIPPQHALSAAEVDLALGAALEAASNLGIRGKALTPFLLAEMEKRTGGRSVDANVALAENNARLAGELAVALHRDAS